MKRETVRVIAVDGHVKTDSYWSVFQHFSVWYSENLSEMLTWLGIFYIRKDLFDSPMKIKICFKLAFFPVTWGHPSGVKRTWEIKENTKEKQGKDGKKTLNSFIKRWNNVPYSPLTEATFIEIENLRKHIQKGLFIRNTSRVWYWEKRGIAQTFKQVDDFWSHYSFRPTSNSIADSLILPSQSKNICRKTFL